MQCPKDAASFHYVRWNTGTDQDLVFARVVSNQLLFKV